VHGKGTACLAEIWQHHERIFGKTEFEVAIAGDDIAGNPELGGRQRVDRVCPGREVIEERQVAA
jgi:hypothetical protein